MVEMVIVRGFALMVATEHQMEIAMVPETDREVIVQTEITAMVAMATVMAETEVEAIATAVTAMVENDFR